MQDPFIYCVYMFQAEALEKETMQLKETLAIEKKKKEQESEEMQREMVSMLCPKYIGLA